MYENVAELYGKIHELTENGTIGGIELSGVVPGGHQIVPGTLRGGGGQDGGGDLQEAVVRHGLPKGSHHVAPEDDVALHCGIPQVQVAVLQAGGLVGLPAAINGEGQLIVLAAAQHHV